MSYLWPSFSKAEISEVKSVLRSGKVNYWTGEQNKKFERICKILSVKICDFSC